MQEPFISSTMDILFIRSTFIYMHAYIHIYVNVDVFEVSSSQLIKNDLLLNVHKANRNCILELQTIRIDEIRRFPIESLILLASVNLMSRNGDRKLDTCDLHILIIVGNFYIPEFSTHVECLVIIAIVLTFSLYWDTFCTIPIDHK